DLRHEGVVAATEGRLEGAWGRRKVRRLREACDIGVAGAVHGDAKCSLNPTPTEKGGVDRRTRRIQPRHEGIADATEGRLEGPGRRRKVRRVSGGRARSVGGDVHGDAGAFDKTAPTERSGVNGRTGSIQL